MGIFSRAARQEKSKVSNYLKSFSSKHGELCGNCPGTFVIVVIRYVCVCVYDKHPLAGRDIQYRAPDSRSKYTTPFDEIKRNMQHLNYPGIPMILVIKNLFKRIWQQVHKRETGLKSLYSLLF